MRNLYCRLAVLMAEKDPRLSQRQLVKEIGLAATTIARLFNNEFSRVDKKTIETLCDYFNCEIQDLFIFK